MGIRPHRAAIEGHYPNRSPLVRRESGNGGGSLVGMRALDANRIDRGGDVVISRGTDHSCIAVGQWGDERGIDLDVGSAACGTAIDVIANDVWGAGMPCELDGMAWFLGRGEIDVGDVWPVDRDALDTGRKVVTRKTGCDDIASAGKARETVISSAVSDGWSGDGTVHGDLGAVSYGLRADGPRELEAVGGARTLGGNASTTTKKRDERENRERRDSTDPEIFRFREHARPRVERRVKKMHRSYPSDLSREPEGSSLIADWNLGLVAYDGHCSRNRVVRMSSSDGKFLLVSRAGILRRPRPCDLVAMALAVSRAIPENALPSLPPPFHHNSRAQDFPSS